MEWRDYYGDPERYDTEYAPFSIDRAWYVKRALQLGGPVLELGCGTGRILFALAAEGLSVDGLDNAPAMLDRARTRAVLLGDSLSSRIGLYEGDLTDFDLGRRYRTIMVPLNGLMHLLTDRDLLACLDRVRAHLAPGGRFLFDLTMPREELIQATSDPAGVPLRNLHLRGAAYQQRERHEYDPATRISKVTYSFLPLGCGGPAFASQLSLRMYPPDEVDRLCRRAGLAILERYGDFKHSPPDTEEDVMQLYVAGRDSDGAEQ